MIGVLAGFASLLLLAGFACGRLRTARAGATRGRAKRSPATGLGLATCLAIVAFPVATLLLAKLFDSAVLGWVFGLSLMAGLALLPCAAIVYLGLRLGSRGTPRMAPDQHGASNLVVDVDRGSVHASDDASARQISVAPQTTLRALLALALADRYLPGISGGRATWIVESPGGVDGAVLRPIAVCAEQWTAPRFLVPPDTSVASHFGGTRPRLHLRYRCQDDPQAVFAALVQDRR